MRFTAKISKLDLNLIADEPSDTEVKETDTSDEEGCSTLLCTSNEVTTTTTPTTETEFSETPVTDLSPIHYPLLSSLGIHTEKHMDKLLQEVVKLSRRKSVHAEAAECLINALYQCFQESFISIAIEKGVARNPEKKMDAASVEAMLSEARLNTKNSRVLFKHLNSFFGQSFFESETKQHEYFAGQD
jgi:hypothetical protein